MHYLTFLTLFVSVAHAAVSFSDVPSSHIHATAIAYVAEQGIVQGYPDGTFRPDQTINRAEFVKILIEATGGLSVGICKIAPFPDSDVTSWYAPYLQQARCSGVVGGYPDGTFRPAGTINVAEAAKIIVEAFGFAHASDDARWYRGYTEALADHHALPSDFTSVDALLTRGAMAEMIYRLHAEKTDLPSRSADDLEHTAMSSSASSSLLAGFLPLGDHKFSSGPKQGYIYSCQTQFNGRGAFKDGSWIQGDTWNPSTKPVVDGKNTWSDARFSITTEGDKRVITGNALPVDDVTGNYPVSSTDDAYQYDRNPNSIKTQTISLSLPLNPVIASTPSCVPMGMIGVALNGVAIFNGFDAEGRDAAAHEILDTCQGHPQQQGMYHYHNESACLGDTNSGGQSPLLGYALDGFGIYGEYDENGNKLTSADLDECHGRTSPVEWNGSVQTMYHYVFTDDYPYSIGCFHGTPVNTGGLGNDAGGGMMSSGGTPPSGGGQMQGPSGNGPPEEAIAACSGKSDNAACTVQTPNGMLTGTCRTVPEGSFACVPR